MKNWPFAAAFCALAISGCTSSNVKETLGLTRSAPDEYRVVSRPPLSVPPNFALRPPSATEPSIGDVSASGQAESIITGGNDSPKISSNGKSVTLKTTQKAPGLAKADAEFLQKAGAERANARVREEMVEERYERLEAKDEAPWWDVFDWTSDKKDPTVDAKKEAERIQTNADEGKSVTEGETPEIKARDTGLLGKIFDY